MPNAGKLTAVFEFFEKMRGVQKNGIFLQLLSEFVYKIVEKRIVFYT